MTAADFSASTSDIPPDLKARPLALFDLDGTLTDPADGILSCHRWALGELDIPFDDSIDLSTLIGPPAEEAHALLGVPDNLIAKSTELYRERFAIAGWLDDTLYDGIDELLNALSSAGWVLGVATMKLEPFANRVLDRVGVADLLDVVSGSDVARTRKTKRDIISHAIASLDQPTRSSTGGPTAGPINGIVMVGDRRHDIEAAKSLGITAIGAAWGFGSIDELIGANADSVALTPHDVQESLLGD